MTSLATGLYGKRVLITGGLGFIGSNLARSLVNAGARVTVLDCLAPQYGGSLHNVDGIAGELDLRIGDLRDARLVAESVPEMDFIFNLAGQTSHMDSMRDPMTDLETNAVAQLGLLECCRQFNPAVRIVFASTRQVYGKPGYLPVDEMHPIRPPDANAVSKLAGEGYHLLYSRVYGVRSTVLRLTNTYGPRMRVRDARQTFVGFWIRNLLEGVPIKVYGDGLQVRDLNYVDDCVDALLLSATHDVAIGKTYNLGGSESVNLTELAREMVSLGHPGSYELVPFPEGRKAIDIGDYRGNYSLIERELGWRPHVALRDGLGRAVTYYVDKSGLYWE